MVSLHKQVEAMTQKLSTTASGKRVDAKALRECLETAASLARRVEASRAVTGFFGMGGGLTDIIENVLSIATPLVAISGDFELSNLLGSLKVWLDKKKMKEAEEERQRQQMMGQTAEDLSFTYGF